MKLKFFEKKDHEIGDFLKPKTLQENKFIKQIILEKKKDFFECISSEIEEKIDKSNLLISKLNIIKSNEKYIKYEFLISTGEEIIKQKVFDMGFIEEVDKLEKLFFVTYFKMETLEEVISHKIICIGTNNHFEDNIFSKVVEKYYNVDGSGLISLEKDGNFKSGEFLETHWMDVPPSIFSVTLPKKRTYSFISRNVYNNLGKGFQDFIIEGIEDGSFELPFMMEIGISKQDN